jgi:prevent-host-death family protein
MMLKSISASDLRAQIKRILNEVGYGRSEYVVEKFGEPIAAVISMEDFRLLQEIKKFQPSGETEKNTTFLTNLEAIHQALQASGYRARTKKEIDAQIQAERESWGA